MPWPIIAVNCCLSFAAPRNASLRCTAFCAEGPEALCDGWGRLRHAVREIEPLPGAAMLEGPLLLSCHQILYPLNLTLCPIQYTQRKSVS